MIDSGCLSMSFTQDIELKNRMSKAWAKFGAYRDELTSKLYPVQHRLRLFASVIQPTFLYGCAAWTLTRDREARIRTLQRKMLRAVVGVRRRVTDDGVLEDWVHWIRRSTHAAEKARVEFKIPDWREEVYRKKFRWAGHVARREDGRWARAVLDWSVSGWRAQGRPMTRWVDCINKFFLGSHCIGATSWQERARDRTDWRRLEVDFVKFSLRR